MEVVEDEDVVEICRYGSLRPSSPRIGQGLVQICANRLGDQPAIYKTGSEPGTNQAELFHKRKPEGLSR